MRARLAVPLTTPRGYATCGLTSKQGKIFILLQRDS